MKNLMAVTIAALICAGCSKPADESQSEQLGQEFANQIKAPIEKARIASEKAATTRDIELPK